MRNDLYAVRMRRVRRGGGGRVKAAPVFVS